MDNPEKLATLGTQHTGRRQTAQKHNTLCVGHHYAQITQITYIRHKPSYKQPEVKTNFREHSKITGARGTESPHTPFFSLMFCLHTLHLSSIKYLYYFTSLSLI